MKTLPKALLGAVGCYAAAMSVHMAKVVADAKKNHRDDCDYLMILGGNVIGADTPSPQLLGRMKTAASYLKENAKCFVVPCGGCFRSEQTKSEAEIIANYLIEQGLDENRIILEDKSTTTFENFIFAFEIIKNHSGKELNQTRIAFLSSDSHLYRASVIAKLCGYENIGKVSAPTDDLKGFIWEFRVAPDLLYRKISKNYFGRFNVKE